MLQNSIYIYMAETMHHSIIRSSHREESMAETIGIHFSIRCRDYGSFKKSALAPHPGSHTLNKSVLAPHPGSHTLNKSVLAPHPGSHILNKSVLAPHPGSDTHTSAKLFQVINSLFGSWRRPMDINIQSMAGTKGLFKSVLTPQFGVWELTRIRLLIKTVLAPHHYSSYMQS